MTKRILVIGELNVDLIVTGLPSLPKLGQEIVCTGFARVLGSSSAIFARALAGLGAQVDFMGKVGDDDNGRFMVRQLEELGIGTAGVIVDPTVQTGVTISLTYPHEKAQITYPGSIAAYRLEDVNLAVLDRYTHLHMASMYLQTGLRPAFPALLRRAKSLGLTTSLDPGWDPAEEWSAGLWEALAATDILFVNEHEAWALGSRLAQTPTALKDFAGAASHSQADLAELLMRGLALSSSKGLARSVPPQESLPRASRGGALLLLVAKLGPQGAMVADRGGVIHVPAHRVEVIDTTGAGDSFDAGFIYQYIIEGRSKAEALRFANACGAIAVTRLGGASSVPTAAEVEAFLRPELEV